MSLFNNSVMMGASGAGAYEIERSLRFNPDDTAYLSRTPSSASNRKTWTFSTWTKRGEEQYAVLFATDYQTSGNYGAYIGFVDDKLRIYDNASSSVQWHLDSEGLFRDYSSWYHIVVVVDTTQGTNTNRVKVYINGTQIGLTATTWPDQNDDGEINSTEAHSIGTMKVNGTPDYKYDGYMAEMHFVDGTALDASSFGETDTDTGAWVPKKYAGSYGTNGFYLNFKDNSNTTAGTLGADSSGNGNNWTPNNFSVASGAGNDSFIDTPTDNFCTMNPLTSQNTTVSNGNLTIAPSGNNSSTFSTMQIPASGKWYFEMTKNSGDPMIGYSSQPSLPRSWQPHAETDALATYFYGNRIECYYGGNTVLDVTDAPWNNDANGTVFGILWDRDNDTIKHRYNNGDEVSFDIPSALQDLPLAFGYSVTTTWPSGNFTYNFGASGFAYTIPTGYATLSSANLPTPTIKNGQDHFDTLLYTGTASTVNGLNFNPDLYWIKSRTGHVNHHILIDKVRGVAADKFLAANGTDAEGSESGAYGYISAATGGFTHVTGSAGGTDGNANFNQSGATYVAWNWLAGNNSTSSNSDGSITSTVSVNSTAGFSIVSYTGTGSAGATVGHGLGVTPDVIIIKNRTDSQSDGGSYWSFYNSSMFNSAADCNIMYLNETNAPSDDTNIHGTSVTINSTVFSLGDYNGTNGSSDNMIAYCFSNVEGYCKSGTYLGNNDSDGPYIYTGFKPAWLLIKGLINDDWAIFDNKRDSYNLMTRHIRVSTTALEYVAAGSPPVELDFTSNGFKHRNSNGQINGSNTYFYLAFAESPFKYATAR